MGWDNITITSEGGVATVRFDRGERLNAFDAKLIEELTEAALAFHADDATRAVVLTGTTRAFSAGADVKEAPETGGLLAERRRSHLGRHMCRAWEEMPQITVAAIDGLAVGGGVALPLALDWRVMAEDAYFYVPEVKLGVNLQWQTIPRLVALVGPARAKRIAILCERMGSAQALDWGLVDEVAPAGEAVPAAQALAARAAEMPMPAATVVKEAVNTATNALLQATAAMDSDVALLLRNAEETQRLWDEMRAGGKPA